MVSFHTRHNLSTQTDPNIGIGAAWNWIKQEMEKSIPASNGRLEIKFVDYTVGGQGQRIPNAPGSGSVPPWQPAAASSHAAHAPRTRLRIIALASGKAGMVAPPSSPGPSPRRRPLPPRASPSP